MKKLGVISVILLLFVSTDLLAQRYPQSEKATNLEARTSASGLYQKNSSIWLDGTKLNRQELSAMDGFDLDLYSKGRTKAGVGTALISLGAVPCVLGTVGLIGTIQDGIRIDKERGKGVEPTPGSGLPQVIMFLGYGTGAILEAIGIPLHCSGKADIRHAAVSYNGQKNVKYSLGPATNGFGIALNF